MAAYAPTTVRAPAPDDVRVRWTDRVTSENHAVRSALDLLSSGPAADPQARRLIAARRWNRRAQHAARRAARASASVR